MKNKKNNIIVLTASGFTLIELIVVMVFAAIILATGIPTFNNVIKNSALTTQTNEFVSALSLARSEAVSRGDRVTVCRSDNSATANPSCKTGSGNWEDGWIVFQDTTASGTRGVVDADDTLIRVYNGLNRGLTLRVGGAMNNFVSFGSQGEATGNSGLGNDTFRLCDSRGTSKAYFVTIIATGRVAASRTANGNTCP